MTKPMLIPYINEKGNAISIGGFQQNIARDLEVDNPEFFLEFLKYLNGKNSFEDIKNKFDLDNELCEEILESLLENGVIQENEKIFDFSKEEYEYYSRNINFFSWIDIKGIYYNYWEVQNILKNSKVLLLGAGGTGSINAINLVRLGIGSVTIVDYDVVDTSNLNRQNFFYEDIGKLKVEALKNHLNRINPFISINIINKKIETLSDILEIKVDFDIVICCIDKPDNVLEIMEEYTSITKIPRILGGYASTIISHSIFKDNTHSYTNTKDNIINNHFDSKNVDKNDFWKWDNAVIPMVANIAGSFATLNAFYYLTKLNILRDGIIHHIDLYNLQSNAFSYYIGENGVLNMEDKTI